MFKWLSSFYASFCLELFTPNDFQLLSPYRSFYFYSRHPNPIQTEYLSNFQCLGWTKQIVEVWHSNGFKNSKENKKNRWGRKTCHLVKVIVSCIWETTNVLLDAPKMSPELVEYAWLALDVKVELAHCQIILVWGSRLQMNENFMTDLTFAFQWAINMTVTIFIWVVFL